MNAANNCKTVLIAFVICHVTTYVASKTSNDNLVLVSLPSDGFTTSSGYKEGSDGSIDLKDHIAGHQHLPMKQGDGSNPVNVKSMKEEDDTQFFTSPGDIRWKEINGGILAKILEKRAPLRMYGNKLGRKKRDAQNLNKRLDYDRMGKRGFEGKRFTDAMRLGKRQPQGGISSFADALRLGKRYGDAMRLGKRDPYDTMRLGKRLDAMRLGKKSAMDTMRLGKRMDEMRFGKRMDQMRLGKRNFNKFMLNDEFVHSISNNNGKRMSDVMRLGKRSDEISQIDSVNPDDAEDKRGFNDFGYNLDSESDEDFTTIKKRMSDVMRLGKRTHKSPTEQMYGKRMSDLMRLGKRFGYDDRVGKRQLYDADMRMGKRAFMDEMRMGKRMGDVMRLGKRTPDAMRLGKRSVDYNAIEYIPIQFETSDLINDDDYEDLVEQL